MNTLKMVIALIAVLAMSVHFWREHNDARTVQANTDTHGFIAVPMPPGVAPGMVLIFAPENCPKEGAQKARSIAEQLTQRGVSNQLTSHYPGLVYEPSPEMDAAVKRLNIVMTGEIPVVLVNGRGKANPSLEEVVAELSLNAKN